MVFRLSQKPPLLFFPHMCVKPRKSNVSGFPLAPGRSIPGGVAPELDEPGLVGMQLQVELRASLTKIGEELHGITVLLEPDNEVISEPHDDHVAVGMPTPPLPDPPVEHVVEIDVREQRRNRCPLR